MITTKEFLHKMNIDDRFRGKFLRAVGAWGYTTVHFAADVPSIGARCGDRLQAEHVQKIVALLAPDDESPGTLATAVYAKMIRRIRGNRFRTARI
jgi:hypothetical protein